MNVFSYSRLERYAKCPKSFYYKYVLEIEEPISEPLALGKAVHAAIERFLKAQWANEKKDISECVAEAVAEAPVPISFDEALQLCLNPAVRERTFCYGPPEIEQRFDVHLDDAGEYGLQGTVDYSERNLTDEKTCLLVDWKTNRAKYGADCLQMRLYAAVLARRYKVEQVLAQLVFLRYHGGACVETAVIDARAMEQAWNWALETAREIEGNIASLQVFGGDSEALFPARPCAFCNKSCGYAYQCTRGVTLQPAKVNSQEDAETLAGDLIRLESATTAMKEALKEWATTTQRPIRLPGGEYRFIPSVAWTFSEAGLQNLCDRITRMGDNCWRYLSIGAAQLKKLRLEDQELILYGKRKQTDTFRFIRNKENDKAGDKHANHQEPAGHRPAEDNAGLAA